VDLRTGRVLPRSAGQFFQGLTTRLTWAVRVVTRNQHAGVASDQDRLRIPPAAEHVWAWFWDLEQGRRAGFSPEPFGYTDIEAWARLCCEEPRPWEVKALMAMDGARRGEHRRLTDPANAGKVKASDTAGMMQLMQMLRMRGG
jgi:hypothetical protein